MSEPAKTGLLANLALILATILPDVTKGFIWHSTKDFRGGQTRHVHLFSASRQVMRSRRLALTVIRTSASSWPPFFFSFSKRFSCCSLNSFSLQNKIEKKWMNKLWKVLGKAPHEGRNDKIWGVVLAKKPHHEAISYLMSGGIMSSVSTPVVEGEPSWGIMAPLFNCVNLNSSFSSTSLSRSTIKRYWPRRNDINCWAIQLCVCVQHTFTSFSRVRASLRSTMFLCCSSNLSARRRSSSSALWTSAICFLCNSSWDFQGPSFFNSWANHKLWNESETKREIFEWA